VFRNGICHLKTAYDPNQQEIAIYEKFGK